MTQTQNGERSAVQDVLDCLPAHGGLVELGKIKIGGKEKQVRTTQGGKEWRAPRKDDYYTITTMSRDKSGDLVVDDSLMSQLIERYGDKDKKLRQIPIRLLSDDIDDAIRTRFVWYAGKTVGASSDGRIVKWFKCPTAGKDFGKAYPEPVEQPFTKEMLEYATPDGKVKLFKPHTEFSCVIAAQEAKWGGVYRMRTTSQITLRQLFNGLVHIKQLLGGVLVGMPLWLVLRPMQVSPGGIVSTVYVSHIEVRGADMLQLQQQALEMARFRITFAAESQKTQRAYQKLLTAPGEESEAEAAEIASEMSPELYTGDPTIMDGVKVDPEKESEPKDYGSVGDRFADDAYKAMRERGFTEADIAAAMAGICNAYGAADHYGIKSDQYQKIVQGIASGRADRFKSKPSIEESVAAVADEGLAKMDEDSGEDSGEEQANYTVDWSACEDEIATIIKNRGIEAEDTWKRVSRHIASLGKSAGEQTTVDERRALVEAIRTGRVGISGKLLEVSNEG